MANPLMACQRGPLLGRRVNKHKLINLSFLMAKASAIGDLVEIEAFVRKLLRGPVVVRHRDGGGLAARGVAAKKRIGPIGLLGKPFVFHR